MLYPLSYRRVGAGDGDRTHATSLEGWNSTIELHPRDDSLTNTQDRLAGCMQYSTRKGPEGQAKQGFLLGRDASLRDRHCAVAQAAAALCPACGYPKILPVRTSSDRGLRVSGSMARHAPPTMAVSIRPHA